MLAVRPELHLEVLVLVVEEEGLHHLVLPQPEVGLARETPGRRGIVIEGSRDGDPDLAGPGDGGQGDVGSSVLQPRPVPGQADGEGLSGCSTEVRLTLLTVSSYLPFSAAVSMVEWWGWETAGDNNTVSKQNTALYGATDRNIFQSLLETIWGPWYLYRGLHSVEVVTGSLCPV